MIYEHRNAEGLYAISQVFTTRGDWRATLDGGTLTTRKGAEAVLKSLLSNDLDERPKRLPFLDTSKSLLPKRLSEWKQARY